MKENRENFGLLKTEEKIASLSTPLSDHSSVDMIRQGNVTNTLTKLKPKPSDIDLIGNATVSRGTFSLTIPGYKNLEGLKTSAYQLLDAITIKLTETGAKDPTVIISLSDYMERRGLKDRKEAKRQAKADLDMLGYARLSWEERHGDKTERYRFVNIADTGEIKTNGDIVFKFGDTFYKTLLKYPIMPYVFQPINNKRNPNSYYLLRRLNEHKNMNAGKTNEDIISVATLLEACPDLPAYEKVMKTGRHFGREIIKPFERDLNALEKTLTWEYCHSKNKPLTAVEKENLDYRLFKTLNIKVSWKSYPDQTARLERKAKKIEKALKKKKEIGG